MNAESSRSHLIISIIIEATNRTTGTVSKGKVCLSNYEAIINHQSLFLYSVAVVRPSADFYSKGGGGC